MLIRRRPSYEPFIAHNSPLNLQNTAVCDYNAATSVDTFIKSPPLIPLHLYPPPRPTQATGAVGKEVVGCLEKRDFPVDKLRIFGSARSAGSVVKTKFGDVEVELFDQSAAAECDVCFLAVSGDFALEHARAISKSCIVIDNSSAFRYEPDVPLVIPEINGKACKGKNLIANPNCTTAIGLMGLSPLMKKFGAKRVLMSTYQASSGAGQEVRKYYYILFAQTTLTQITNSRTKYDTQGMDELKAGTIQVTSGEKEVADHKHFAHPLPFNVIPHIDKFQENGYTKEEMKVTWETRKICDMPDDFPVSCTAVRIPTFRAHSETIVLETEQKVDVKVAQDLLASSPGVKLVDDVQNTEVRRLSYFFLFLLLTFHLQTN